MALLGSAALAMWWDIAPDVRSDFEDWHAHEHFPERLNVPGFRRATRWRSADGGEGMFVVYELSDFEVLSSPAYAARLNAPTPWSTRLMPHHRQMIRSQCRVLESRGGLVSRYAATTRLSPLAGQDGALRERIREDIDSNVSNPGITGGHLLRHQTPGLQPTVEQRIRKHADGVADWVLILSGYDRDAVIDLSESVFGAGALQRAGAAPGMVKGLYRIAHSALPGDVV